MHQDKRVGAVILMGGIGSRLGNNLPKQFLLLGKKQVYQHTLDAFSKVGIFDEIILVCHPDWVTYAASQKPKAKLVRGGATRQESSYLGLKGFSKPPDIVVIHDAVRPFISEKILLENVKKAFIHGAVNTCIASTDTLVYAPDLQKIGHIPVRAHYLRGQTPQSFRFDWILMAHVAAIQEGIEGVSDDCQLVLRQGRPIHIVEGCDRNIKITTETDLIIAKQLDKLIN